MKLDISSYEVAWGQFPNFLELQKGNTMNEIISNFTIASGVPTVLVCYFYQKTFGDSLELQAKIARLTEFYNYEEIIGLELFLKSDIITKGE